MLKKSVLLLSLSMLLGVAPLLSTRRPQLPLRHTSDSSFEELLERLYRDLPENIRNEFLSLLGAASLFSVLMWILNRNERLAPVGDAASNLSAVASSATGLGLSFGSNFSGRDADLPNSRGSQASLGAADRLAVSVVAATQGQLGAQAETIRVDPIVAQLRASAQAFEEAQRRSQAESSSSASSTDASSREPDQTRESTQEYENSMDPIIAQILASEQALRRAQQSHPETQSSSLSGISANSTQGTSESNPESNSIDREATQIMVRRILAHYFSMRSTQSTMNSQSFNQFFEQALNRAVGSCLADIRQFRRLGWNGDVRELTFFVTESSVGIAIIVLPPDEVNSNIMSCSCPNCLRYQEISKEARRRMVATKGESRLIARLGQLAVYSHTGVTRREIHNALRSLVDSRIDAGLIERQLEQSIINQPIIQSALRDVYGRLVDQAVVIISSRLETPEVEIEEEEHDLSIYLSIEPELDAFLDFVMRVSRNLAQSHTIDLSSFLSKKK